MVSSPHNNSQQKPRLLRRTSWWETKSPMTLHYTVWVGVLGLTIAMTVQVANKLLPQLGAFRYLVVLVFDGGMLHWLHTLLRVAKTKLQLIISGFMLVVSVLGVLVMIGTEVLVAGGQHFTQAPDWLARTAVYATWIVIALDVVAFVLFEIQTHWDKVKFQEAMASISDLSFQMFSSRKDEIAAIHANRLAEAALHNLEAVIDEQVLALERKAGIVSVGDAGPNTAPSHPEQQPVDYSADEIVAAAQAILAAAEHAGDNGASDNGHHPKG